MMGTYQIWSSYGLAAGSLEYISFVFKHKVMISIFIVLKVQEEDRQREGGRVTEIERDKKRDESIVSQEQYSSTNMKPFSGFSPAPNNQTIFLCLLLLIM